MKIAIIGTGSIGSRHIYNIQSQNPQTKFTFIRQSGYTDDLSVRCNANVVKELADGDVYDAIVIANPSSMHMDSLEKIIKNNMCCFVEKPIVTDLQDCHKLYRLIEKYCYTATSMVGCNLRYLPSLQKMKNLIETGALGKIIRVSLEAGKWLPDWRPTQDYRKSYSAYNNLGGGVILDLIHEVDMVRWIFGDYSDFKAYASKLSDLEIETEDTACIILSRENGPLVSVNLDYISRDPVRKYRVIGTQGTIEWDLNRQLLTLTSASSYDVICDNPEDFDVSKTYIFAMDEFMQAVKNKQKTSQGIVEGIKTAELALRIKESI